MELIKNKSLPKGWRIVKMSPCTFGRGKSSHALKLIFLCSPKVGGFWGRFLTQLIFNYEYGHAWGVDKCHKPWCLMYCREKLYQKILHIVSMFRWFKPCKQCLRIITYNRLKDKENN